jgi:hypothetical protein
MSRSKELVNIEGRELQHEQHFLIIDEYFNNGFNGSKAILKHRPGITEATSRSLFNTISKLDHVKAYIGEKRQQLRAQTNIEPEQVINELITWIYSDATDYISLTPQEVKSLPREARQCIQSIKHRKKTFYDPKGKPITEEVLEVRLTDKLKAVEILNKMLNNYELDNKGKAPNVNIGQLNVNELKVLANILNKGSK